MSLAELVITSVNVEGRTKSEVARDHKISRYWVQQLLKRYEREGPAAPHPRSRRPHHNPRAGPGDRGPHHPGCARSCRTRALNARAETIRTHLQRDATLQRTSAVSTIWRILTRRGFITPQPKKRPRSAGTRFEAYQPNERWQADVTHWQLADGSSVEILNLIDDHPG